jgi:hypothetical protein
MKNIMNKVLAGAIMIAATSISADALVFKKMSTMEHFMGFGVLAILCTRLDKTERKVTMSDTGTTQG